MILLKPDMVQGEGKHSRKIIFLKFISKFLSFQDQFPKARENMKIYGKQV